MTGAEVMGLVMGLGLVWVLWEESRGLAIGALVFISLAVYVTVANGP